MTAPRQPIEVREFPRPDLPPGAVLLKTSLSEVCGTDVHLWHGRLSGVPYPIIPGHVSAGVVDAARGAVTGIDGSPIREGDRIVFFDVHRTCGRCRACTVHRTPTRCASRRVYGITDSADEGLFGGWAQAVYLEPGVALARLPDAVSLDDYIGGGCGLLTAVHIAERAEIRLGDAVVVQGVGAVGLSAIALARIAGASMIIAIGAPGDRLALARDMGADLLLDLAATTNAERQQAVFDATHGEGADVVIEAAGTDEAWQHALGLVRPGGTVVYFGGREAGAELRVDAYRLHYEELTLRGAFHHAPRHVRAALAFLASGAVPWQRLITHRVRLEDVPALLADPPLDYLKAAVVP